MNETISLPDNKDWDLFWKQDKVHINISWSKRRITSLLSNYINSKINVLDVGCGSGFFSNYFCQYCNKVSSLDYSNKALELTRKITGGKTELICADILEQGLMENINKRFDLIFSDGLLEHFSLDKQRRILDNLYSLLNPGGRIITFVPNKWSPWQIIRPFFMPGIKETPFILKDLIKLHRKASFNIEKSGGINTLPFRVSPDRLVGKLFGMLLFVVGQKER